MARFEFRDDDDGEETDYDSPSKEHWDNKPHHHFPADYYGEKEEGEIIEDESIDKMDENGDYEDGDNQITDDYNNYNQEMDEGNSFRNTQFPEEEFIDRHDSRNSGRSFGSYFPWRNRRRTSEGSPSSEGSSFRAESPKNCYNESHEDEFHNSERDNVNNNSSSSEHGEGNEEYRLIASTKYDRNYEMSDFFPRGIRSNNSHESNNNNSYRAPVSDDEEHDISYNRSYSSDRYTNEDGNNRTNNRSNGELVRSSTRQHSSSGAPEVHYHIYVSDRQASRWFDSSENDGRPQLSQEENCENEIGIPKGRMLLWKKVTLLAVITQVLVFLVGRYNLVSLSPPPSYLTWEEYRNHQFWLIKKVSKEGISLLNHIGRATASSVFSTKEDETSNILPPRYAFPMEWESFVPPLGITNYEKRSGKTRKTTIFGQDEALEHLRMGLSLWSSSQKFYTTARQSWRYNGYSTFESLQHQQPLIVYVSGGKGVGKDSLAYLLLEQLKSNDTKTDVPALAEVCAKAFAANKNTAERDSFEVKKAREIYCPLLHLIPSDYHHQNRPFSYFDEDYNGYDLESEDSFSPLYREILDHVIAAGGGASIVILENVDSPSLPSTWLRDLMTEVQSQQSIFGNTIFFLTSQIGTNTVEKWSRKRLQSIQGVLDNSSAEVAGNTEVEALLRYELKSHHDVDSEGDGDGNVSLGIENWLLIPMSPLDQNAMSLILQSITSNVKASAYFGKAKDQSYDTAMSTRPSILLTESASKRILDALEWHQWIHKTTGEVLRIWSPDGAHALFDLWEEHVLESIEHSSSCPRDAYSPKAKLILDFEGISTDRLWLRSCELAEKGGGQFDITSNDGRRWKCAGESCSFFL